MEHIITFSDRIHDIKKLEYSIKPFLPPSSHPNGGVLCVTGGMDINKGRHAKQAG